LGGIFSFENSTREFVVISKKLKKCKDTMDSEFKSRAPNPVLFYFGGVEY
jgi:hypothetical protein